MNYIDPVKLKEFVEANPKLVRRKASTRYPGLYTLKYTSKVFYDAMWKESEYLLETRGLVVDAAYNVVAKPLTKVFNYGENGTTFHRDTLCTVVKKINGFMACATYRPDIDPNGLIVSTTGTLDSDFVDLARSHIEPVQDEIMKVCRPGTSWIFEVCDETDPHIIKEEFGLYLIGGNYIEDNEINRWDEYQINAAHMVLSHNLGDKIKRPEVRSNIRFSDVVQESKTVKHEGFMVYSKEGAMKIKSPYYLTTKFVARIANEKLEQRIENGTLRKNIDEEYYPLLDHIGLHLLEFTQLDEQGRIAFVENYFRYR